MNSGNCIPRALLATLPQHLPYFFMNTMSTLSSHGAHTKAQLSATSPSTPPLAHSNPRLPRFLTPHKISQILTCTLETLAILISLCPLVQSPVLGLPRDPASPISSIAGDSHMFGGSTTRTPTRFR